ncbi:fibronectin type III domain-containing protein, partial [Flavobacterium oreochromis]|uniref:fibronectin type III domain-containing protein n=2 Tax=Flavobacterium oreochromis TaxID=2906078 RepID=UPI00385D9817
PQIGFLTAPLLYEEETRGTALLYDISKPNLLSGKRYAWRVKAISTSGLSVNNVFKNEGYSEIYHFTYASNCPAPSFVLSEALSARSVRVSWLGDHTHTKYHVQYRKANVAGAEWFEVYTMNTQTTLSDLEAGTTYEFRVGGSCEPAVLGNMASFTYSGINTFTMQSTRGTANSNFTCGLKPSITIANQTPITNLIINETFTAGDFPVKILELSGGNGNYSGKGYVIVPYLADTKIAVEFTNITINTSYQLIKGVVETSYNPQAPNISDLDPLIVDVFGSQSTTNEIIDISTNNSSSGNNQITVDQGNSSGTGGLNSNSGNENNPNIDSTVNSNNPIAETSSTVSNTPENPIRENPNNGTKNDYLLMYNNKKYSNGEAIKIPYNRTLLTDEKFELVDLPNDVEVKYEISYNSQMGNEKDKYNDTFGDYLKKNQSKDQVSIDFSLDNTLRYKIKSTALINGDPFNINDIVLTPTVFKLDKIKVIDLGNTNRFAFNGQTLYYVTKRGVKNRNTKFSTTIAPNLNSEEIPYESIEWWLNHQLWRDGLGKNEFSHEIYNNKNVTVRCKAGYPVLYGSEVKVKWVEGGLSSDNLAFNFDKIDKIKGYLDKFRNYIDIPVFTSLQHYNNSVDPISLLFAVEYLNERENIESEENRLYFTKIKNQFTLNLGIKGTIEKPIPSLAIPEYEKELFGKKIKFALGIYWFIEANAKGEIGANRTYKKWVETNTSENSNWIYNEPSNLEIRATIGLNPKVNAEVSGFKVEVSGKSQASAGVLKIDMSNGFKVSCPLVDEGLNLSCSPVASIEVGPFSYTHTFDKYEYNLKF